MRLINKQTKILKQKTEDWQTQILPTRLIPIKKSINQSILLFGGIKKNTPGGRKRLVLAVKDSQPPKKTRTKNWSRRQEVKSQKES